MGVPRGPAQDAQASEIGMTEENRRVLEWIAQLMKPTTREAALLELSKKREQVPELALILWHSFGMWPSMSMSTGANTQQVLWLLSYRRSSPSTHY